MKYNYGKPISIIRITVITHCHVSWNEMKLSRRNKSRSSGFSETTLYGVTTQKTSNWIFTAVKIPNLAQKAEMWQVEVTALTEGCTESWIRIS